MERVKITAQESEAVERAFYEEQSYGALVSIIARQISTGGEADATISLRYYAELYRMAQMRLQMVQNKIIARYFDPERLDGAEVRFDFDRQEVYPIAKIKEV